MTEPAQPNYEVTISEELRGLFWGVATASHAREPSKTHRGSGPQREATVSEGPWHPISLRRDGRRPLRFKGALLVERIDCSEAGIQEGADPSSRKLSIFLTEHAQLVVQLSFEPSEELAARPIYRVAALEAPCDLGSFLGRTGPETCFGVDPSDKTPEGRHRFIHDLNLTKEIPGLTLALQ